MNSMGVLGAFVSNILMGYLIQDRKDTLHLTGRALWDPVFDLYIAILLLGGVMWLFVNSTKSAVEPHRLSETTPKPLFDDLRQAALTRTTGRTLFRSPQRGHPSRVARTTGREGRIRVGHPEGFRQGPTWDGSPDLSPLKTLRRNAARLRVPSD